MKIEDCQTNEIQMLGSRANIAPFDVDSDLDEVYQLLRNLFCDPILVSEKYSEFTSVASVIAACSAIFAIAEKNCLPTDQTFIEQLEVYDEVIIRVYQSKHGNVSLSLMRFPQISKKYSIQVLRDHQ